MRVLLIEDDRMMARSIELMLQAGGFLVEKAVAGEDGVDLAEVYALMVYYHEHECDEHTMPERARAAWLAWYETTPDTPCIAICSTT